MIEEVSMSGQSNIGAKHVPNMMLSILHPADLMHMNSNHQCIRMAMLCAQQVAHTMHKVHTAISQHGETQHKDYATGIQALHSDHSKSSEQEQFNVRTIFLAANAVVISRDYCKMHSFQFLREQL